MKLSTLKNQILILFIFLNFSAFSQEAALKKERKIHFLVGTEYRITPFDQEKTFSNYRDHDVYYNLDYQITGPSLNLGIEYDFMKNYSIGFSHSLSYGHIYFDTRTIMGTYNNESTINKSVNGLKQDYNFYLKRKFNLNNGDKIGLKVGYSLMNRGTRYSQREVTEFSDGSIGVIYRDDKHFKYSAFNLEASYEVEKFNFGFGVYSIDGNHSFGNEAIFWMPYIRVTYTIF